MTINLFEIIFSYFEYVNKDYIDYIRLHIDREINTDYDYYVTVEIEDIFENYEGGQLEYKFSSWDYTSNLEIFYEKIDYEILDLLTKHNIITYNIKQIKVIFIEKNKWDIFI